MVYLNLDWTSKQHSLVLKQRHKLTAVTLSFLPFPSPSLPPLSFLPSISHSPPSKSGNKLACGDSILVVGNPVFFPHGSILKWSVILTKNRLL